MSAASTAKTIVEFLICKRKFANGPVEWKRAGVYEARDVNPPRHGRTN